MDLRSLSCSGEDRISGLSDGLIHHILSFIDMKYAVRTCVLSKRWSEIWISLPFLNFNSSLGWERGGYSDDDYSDDDDYVSRNRVVGFTYFVKMVFFLRDNSDITRFRLFLDKTFSGDLGKLILAAVRRNAQELDIEYDVPARGFFQLPGQVFRCKSLRKLKLKTRCNGDAKFNIPKSASLHQLNSLILDGFRIPNIESFSSLFSSCPLSELRIIHCRSLDLNDVSVTIDSLYLQTLELVYFGVPVGSIIKLNAPNIKSFICKDKLVQEYSLGNLSSLVTADITMSLKDEKGETAKSYLGLSEEQNDIYGKRMMEFLGAIDNVKDLKLSSGFLEVLSKAPGLLDCQPPKFCNLQYLELKVWFTRGCMQATTYLLKISPNLKSIVLALEKSGLPDIGENWEAGSSSQCILSKLRYVEIREVEGCDNEVKLLGFLLKSANVLEELALFFRSTVGSLERVRQVKRFRDQLRSLPRASSIVNIMFF